MMSFFFFLRLGLWGSSRPGICRESGSRFVLVVAPGKCVALFEKHLPATTHGARGLKSPLITILSPIANPPGNSIGNTTMCGGNTRSRDMIGEAEFYPFFSL